MAFTSTISFSDEINASLQPLEPAFENLPRTANVHEDVLNALRMEEIFDREMSVSLDTTEEGLAKRTEKEQQHKKRHIGFWRNSEASKVCIMHKTWKKKKTPISKVKNDKGETNTSREGIAYVFGEFYIKLHAEDQLGKEVLHPHNSETRVNIERESRIDEVKNEIPEFTQDEVQTAIESLKKN